jgi:hypothetical protein
MYLAYLEMAFGNDAWSESMPLNTRLGFDDTLPTISTLTFSRYQAASTSPFGPMEVASRL